jgi:hypothetical protein
MRSVWERGDCQSPLCIPFGVRQRQLPLSLAAAMPPRRSRAAAFEGGGIAAALQRQRTHLLESTA